MKCVNQVDTLKPATTWFVGSNNVCTATLHSSPVCSDTADVSVVFPVDNAGCIPALFTFETPDAMARFNARHGTQYNALGSTADKEENTLYVMYTLREAYADVTFYKDSQCTSLLYSNLNVKKDLCTTMEYHGVCNLHARNACLI